MNKKVKATWLRALRSGKYKQGFRALKKNDEYCCLGVLCEIAIKSRTKDAPHIELEIRPDKKVNFNGCTGYPPREIINWAGVDDTVVYHLGNMNDLRRKSFTQIADWIEANL